MNGVPVVLLLPVWSSSKDLTDPTAHIAWKQVHTDALVVDFLLREGCIQSAQLLAEEAGVQVCLCCILRPERRCGCDRFTLRAESSQDFVDVEIFRNAHHVAQAILNHDIGPAQAWCSNHASKLRRIDRSADSAAADWVW